MNLLLGPIFALINTLADKFIPDPQKKAEMQLELAKMAQEGQLKDLEAELAKITGQMDINKVEAASSNIFVSGWRPFIGWICGSAFAMQFIVGPMLTWGAALLGHPVEFPKLDVNEMNPVLYGMLGLGVYRTVEKIKGKA